MDVDASEAVSRSGREDRAEAEKLEPTDQGHGMVRRYARMLSQKLLDVICMKDHSYIPTGDMTTQSEKD